MDKAKLYEFQIAHAKFDPIIKMLLRLYGGELISGFPKISEPYIAKGLKISTEEVINTLKHLHELQVVIYQPAKDKPQVTFILPRQDAERLPLNLKRLEDRKKLIFDKMKAMVSFVTISHRCRMQLIQDYFNEVSYKKCGICDVCIEERKKDNRNAFENLRDEVTQCAEEKILTVEQVEEFIAPKDHELFVDVVREMVDEGVLDYDTVGNWVSKLNRKC